jgi:hypothetical protein
MYRTDIGWNSNLTPIQTEKANKIILKEQQRAAEPILAFARAWIGGCCVLGSG